VSVPEIDIAELDRRRVAGGCVLDVRELDEYATAHIDGVVHIPLSELVERRDELTVDDEKLVICARGSRSLQAAEYLAALGHSTVNVSGGMYAWIGAGLPVSIGVDMTETP